MFAGLENPFSLLIFTISFLFSLSVHEAAHAWVADRFGDPTAKFSGRLTLNPLAHLDPIGTLLLLFFGFGWGKPVPIDEFNLNNPRRDTALISLGGPAANLISALFFSFFWWSTYQIGINNFVIDNLLPGLIHLNVILGIFNLLPIYPLDGSKILIGILPKKIAQTTEQILKQYGIFLIILVFLPIFSGQSLINLFLVPIINLIITTFLFWLT
ncbi:MAG: site-2 protease family protein [Candidatus Shapirobacteria bacterium]|nr:site-2 protease family protein [Candidatus Shapirobacteria bacterium]